MLKLKENVDLKELEKFGFVNGNYVRKLENKYLYRVFVTRTHRYIQIQVFEPSSIAGSLQTLIYDLTKANIIEKE